MKSNAIQCEKIDLGTIFSTPIHDWLQTDARGFGLSATEKFLSLEHQAGTLYPTERQKK
jgi:hypothetical protein